MKENEMLKRLNPPFFFTFWRNLEILIHFWRRVLSCAFRVLRRTFNSKPEIQNSRLEGPLSILGENKYYSFKFDASSKLCPLPTNIEIGLKEHLSSWNPPFERRECPNNHLQHLSSIQNITPTRIDVMLWIDDRWE